MTDVVSSRDRFAALLNELEDDSLQEVDSETVHETYQNLYKHGQIIEGADAACVFSSTNLSQKYQQRLLMTSVVAFLNRACDEWDVPDDTPVFPVYDYCKGLEEGHDLIDEYVKKHPDLAPNILTDLAFTKEKMYERWIVTKFLERQFQFNPDRHVRSAYRPQPKDNNRKIIETPSAKLAIEHLKFKDIEFRQEMLNYDRTMHLMNMAGSVNTKTANSHFTESNSNNTQDECNLAYSVDKLNDIVDSDCDIVKKISHEFEKSDEQLYAVVNELSKEYTDIDSLNVQCVNGEVNAINNAFEKINERFSLSPKVLNEIKLELQEAHNEQLGKIQHANLQSRSVLQDIISKFHKKYGMIDGKVLVNTYNMIPPADTFHRLNTYFESNYDKLIEATANLYCEVPYLDLAVLPHQWFSSKSTSKDGKENWTKNEEQARAYVKRHRNLAITSMITARSGMWNFYAPYEKVRDSTVFFNDKTIVLEEIMNQIKRDEQLGEELMKNKIRRKKKENIKKEGGEAKGFQEWKKQNSILKDLGAITVNQDDDCPPDALEVPVFRVDKDGVFKRDVFYTQAEAPTYIEQAAEEAKKIGHTPNSNLVSKQE